MLNKKVLFEKGKIWIDGASVQILSGAIHYFRVPEDLWMDRLLKLKQCGLNTVETYICWNLHEPEPGVYDFSGMLNLEKYIDQVQQLGLYMILRPGPFICAEWDNGGLPVWLMTEKVPAIRCMSRPYLKAVKRYFEHLIPIMARAQLPNGGPVIAIQVENEYGSYADDTQYLSWIRDLMRSMGITIPLFTADNGHPFYLSGGTLPDLPMTLTFGSHARKVFELSRKMRPEDPPFCSEFWLGWFDAWGGEHKRRSAEDVAKELDDMLSIGGNVNFYMFHGGTNFGFNSGANGSFEKDYSPTTTSYDYDAPLNECGDPTDKYYAIQNIIRKYHPKAEFGRPHLSSKIAYGTFPFSGSAPLLKNLNFLAVPKTTKIPHPMEYFGQKTGFIHYRTYVKGPCDGFFLYGIRDRAQVFLDGKYIATCYRNDEKCEIKTDFDASGATLDILVENMGHINYGPMINRDFKGITQAVTTRFNRTELHWQTWNLPLDNLDNLSFSDYEEEKNIPAFYLCEFEVSHCADSFLQFPGKKGCVWLNGINLGRYWDIGPTSTLYIPAPFLKNGKNQLIVLELHTLKSSGVTFTDSMR